MDKRWAWAGVAAAAAAAGIFYWSGQPDVVGDHRDPETVARGEAVYVRNCVVCHGEAGRGENPAEPMGGFKPGGGYLAPALDGTGHAWHHAPDVLFRVVKEGSPAQDSPMRGFVGKLSDEEIGAVIAYFRSRWPDAIQAKYDEMHHH